MLNAAHKHGKNVKHVIITSSSLSVAHQAAPGHVFTEDDWNDGIVHMFDNWKGEPINPFLAYIASKNEAERAVWKFKTEHQPAFKITTILPPATFGPKIHHATQPESSVGMMFAYFAGFKVHFFKLKIPD